MESELLASRPAFLKVLGKLLCIQQFTAPEQELAAVQVALLQRQQQWAAIRGALVPAWDC